MKLDVKRSVEISRSGRARQLEAMFDVPPEEKATMRWEGDFPFDAEPWSIGLIVGPSGCGKSTILSEVFGDPVSFDWGAPSVVDDFRDDIPIDDIAAVCQAVGFNTIPAWLRPHAVLSNGEQFRVMLARALIEATEDETIVVDEFTSVVDRQVAQIGAYAVQKSIRKNPGTRFVAASCHYDIIDWLQPDWILEPATMTFARKEWQRRPDGRHKRPELNIDIYSAKYEAWRLFAPFHYLSADLNKAARCFVLECEGKPAAFAGVLHRPHPKSKNVKGLSRIVTLPDWQGLGLAFVLMDTIAAAYRSAGWRFRTYPAHPALMHSFDRSENYALMRKPVAEGYKRNMDDAADPILRGSQGGRPNAVFEYCGPPHPQTNANKLLNITNF